MLGGTGTVHRGNRREFRGQASIRKRSWRGRRSVRRVREQGDACSVHTRGGLSYPKKNGPDFLPSVSGFSSLSLVDIEYLGSTVWDIARGLPCPAKPAGEDVAVVIQGSQRFS